MVTLQDLKRRAEKQIREEKKYWQEWNRRAKYEPESNYYTPAVKAFILYQKEERLKKRNNNGAEEVEIDEELPVVDEHLPSESEFDNIALMDSRSSRKTPMRHYLENGGMTALALGKATQTSIAEQFGKSQSTVSKMIRQIKAANKKQKLAKIQ